MIDIELTCPLGSKCEEARDGKIYRCAWFTEIKGSNPQTGEHVDERACAMAWLPILQIEHTNATRGVHSAVVSVREETLVRQDAAIKQLLDT